MFEYVLHAIFKHFVASMGNVANKKGIAMKYKLYEIILTKNYSALFAPYNKPKIY